MSRNRVVAFVTVLVVVGVVAGVVFQARSSASVPPAKQALDLTHEMMSPYCPGLTLAACPSPAAYDLRAEIRARFERGEARDSIEGDLLARFGTGIQGTPPASGLGLVVWLLPAVVAGALAVGIRAVLRRGEADSAGADEPEPEADARLRDRLADELDALD